MASVMPVTTMKLNNTSASTSERNSAMISPLELKDREMNISGSVVRFSSQHDR